MRHELELDPEAMRAFGHRVVDMLVEQWGTLRDQPATRTATRAEMERRLREPAPAAGKSPDEVLSRLQRDVLEPLMSLNHPRFFGWVPGPVNFVSVMAEAIGATFNPFMGSWLVSAGPTQVELVTVDWLRELVGLPEGAGGLFVSGGSMANLTALAAARHHVLGADGPGRGMEPGACASSAHDGRTGTVYYSDETHSSIERALRVLGFPQSLWRPLPSDDAQRLELAALDRALAEDIAQGLRPCCVIGNAGTTNTGAIDPLAGIAQRCRQHGVWFHVDGAYGAPAMLAPGWRDRFAGIESADSVTLDPHKWLFQPYETGCLLVRERRLLREAFSIFRDYMRDAVGPDDEVNLRDHGLQLTRNFRALKLWMSIQVFGMDAFRDAVAHGIDLAEFAEASLRKRRGWEIVTPAQIGLVTFRWVGAGASDAATIDAQNQRMSQRMYADGFAVISSTQFARRPVLRLCTINPRTTQDDITQTLDKLESFA